jgi:hypothetical protein
MGSESYCVARRSCFTGRRALDGSRLRVAPVDTVGADFKPALLRPAPLARYAASGRRGRSLSRTDFGSNRRPCEHKTDRSDCLVRGS